MKQFYLVENEDGVRFIPSVGLHYAIPCMVLGEMSMDVDFDFSALDLRRVNDLLHKVDDAEASLTRDAILAKYGIKEFKDK